MYGSAPNVDGWKAVAKMSDIDRINELGFNFMPAYFFMRRLFFYAKDSGEHLRVLQKGFLQNEQSQMGCHRNAERLF